MLVVHPCLLRVAIDTTRPVGKKGELTAGAEIVAAAIVEEGGGILAQRTGMITIVLATGVIAQTLVVVPALVLDAQTVAAVVHTGGRIGREVEAGVVVVEVVVSAPVMRPLTVCLAVPDHVSAGNTVMTDAARVEAAVISTRRRTGTETKTESDRGAATSVTVTRRDQSGGDG